MPNILTKNPLVIDTTGDISQKSLTGIAVYPNLGTDTVTIQRRRSNAAVERVFASIGQVQWTFPRPVTLYQGDQGFTVTITGTPIVFLYH